MNKNHEIWNEKWNDLASYSVDSAGNRWAYYLIQRALKGVQVGNGQIVDVGCGIGNKTAELAKAFPNNSVYGLDFAEKGVEFAKEHYSSIKNVSYICGDALDFASNSKNKADIEMISAFELIEHIEDWQQFLDNICRVTNRYIFLSTPTGKMREYEKYMGHYRNFKRGELEHYLESKGFKKVRVMYAGFPFWSPITRDVLNLKKEQSEQDNMLLGFNKTIHAIMYFLYRYCTSIRCGDELLLIYEKCENN